MAIHGPTAGQMLLHFRSVEHFRGMTWTSLEYLYIGEVGRYKPYTIYYQLFKEGYSLEIIIINGDRHMPRLPGTRIPVSCVYRQQIDVMEYEAFPPSSLQRLFEPYVKQLCTVEQVSAYKGQNLSIQAHLYIQMAKVDQDHFSLWSCILKL